MLTSISLSPNTSLINFGMRDRQCRCLMPCKEKCLALIHQLLCRQSLWEAALLIMHECDPSRYAITQPIKSCWVGDHVPC